MKRKSGLRRRLTIAVVAYSLLVAAAVATHGYLVNERAEHLVWQSLLESELDHFGARKAGDPDYRFVDTDTLKLYGPRSGKTVAAELAALTPGVHDEVRTPDGLFVALVRPASEGGDVLALDITDIERGERRLTVVMASSAGVVALALALVTYFGVGWLVAPLSSIARTIAGFAPDRSGQRVSVATSAPAEAEVIAVALNGYLERIDEFVLRERVFLNMASHELRTPIAVIAGAAEVALDERADSSRVRSRLDHVLRTAREMERLVSLLVALAKDPSRLRAAAEDVDLGELLPAVVRDHAFLAQRKELTFRLCVGQAATIRAPEQVARAAIGNLVRNAVENSERGLIEVRAEGALVVIEDPGHGMSDEEMSALYTRLARAGDAPASTGIGLELIARLCEHLGWNLSMSSAHGKGTRAVLDLGAAAHERGAQDSDMRAANMADRSRRDRSREP